MPWFEVLKDLPLGHLGTSWTRSAGGQEGKSTERYNKLSTHSVCVDPEHMINLAEDVWALSDKQNIKIDSLGTMPVPVSHIRVDVVGQIAICCTQWVDNLTYERNRVQRATTHTAYRMVCGLCC